MKRFGRLVGVLLTGCQRPCQLRDLHLTDATLQFCAEDYQGPVHGQGGTVAACEVFDACLRRADPKRFWQDYAVVQQRRWNEMLESLTP